MTKPIEIKVSECENCLLWDYNMMVCTHPNNMYDGGKSDEFIEHCPLKESETIIKFVRENKES